MGGRDGSRERQSDRRTFLKQSATALSAVSLSSCAPGQVAEEAAGGGRPGLEPTTLRAVAEVALPTELGAEGRERAVSAFEAWLADFEPVAELNHGYGTAEISYAPPDPGAAWRAQLDALELEARKRHEAGFTDLPGDVRRELLVRQLADVGERLPSPARARHVAVALMAHFAASPGATDLCYGAAIGKQTCRGIASASEAPRTIDAALLTTAGPSPMRTARGRTPRPSAADHAVGLGD